MTGRTSAATTLALPGDIASFTGREGELARLADAPASASAGGRVVAIHAAGGRGGTGTTTFAVHAAHRLADQFPDGQFFLPLHAHTPGYEPVSPADALVSLLLAAGVPPGQIPGGIEARMARWRDQVAGKMLLLVLDDAAGHEQVRPLLPASGSSMVLVTSRQPLTALDDATAISLGTLPPDEAAALLDRLADRPGLHPGDPAVSRITGLCGYLPLAIGMLARQLHHRPALTATDLAAGLARARDRLEHTRAGDLPVAAAFSLCYAGLSGRQQQLFRSLGLHPGLDIDAYPAAALTGVSLAQARRELDELCSRYLACEPFRGRYRLHDLLGEYARALAADDPEPGRLRAAGRLLDYYQQAAMSADASLPSVRPAVRTAAPPTMDVPGMTGHEDAQEWMRAERANLVACIGQAASGGEHARVVGLTAAIAAHLLSDGPWGLARTLHASAVGAARLTGDRAGEAGAMLDLALVRRVTGDSPAAAEGLEQALAIYTELGSPLGQAVVLGELGIAAYLAGDYEAAASAFERAFRIYLDLGNRLGQAHALCELGIAARLAGELSGAASAHEKSLRIYRDLGNRPGQAFVLNELGIAANSMTDYEGATAVLEQALEINRDLGYLTGQAHALRGLGTAEWHTGNYGSATAELEQALEIYTGLGHRPGQASTLTVLAGVRRMTGGGAAAAGLAERAADISRGIGDRLGEANAVSELGIAWHAAGDDERAAQTLLRAMEIYGDLGERLGQAEAFNHMGAVLLARGDQARARGCHLGALDVARAIGNPLEEARALEGLGRCDLTTSEASLAPGLLLHALEIYRRIGASEASRLAEQLDAAG